MSIYALQIKAFTYKYAECIQDYSSFSVQLTTYIVWAFPIRKTKPYNHLSPSWRLQN